MTSPFHSLFCRSDCFLVADGLGGHENGEEASAQAIRYVSGNYSGNIGDESVSALLSGADEAVRTDGDGGKSTLAALFFSGNKARFANVGDSRVYYFRNGKILARTKDHSVCQASIDMGEMNPEDVRGSDDRSGLFKVLGADCHLKVPKLCDTVTIQDGDAFLLCSDDFWEYVYEMEMEADLLKSECAADWLRHMVKRLLLRSENAGDNYTAICGIIHAAEAVPAPKRRVCSPVLIACLAASLIMLGAFFAVRMLTPNPSEPTSAAQTTSDITAAAQNAADTTSEPTQTAEPSSPTEQTHETAEPASLTEEAGVPENDEQSVTSEQNSTTELSGTTSISEESSSVNSEVHSATEDEVNTSD